MTSAQVTRKFALVLHSLHDDDRNWILGQLDEVTALGFTNLLCELEHIGFEANSQPSLNGVGKDNQIAQGAQDLHACRNSESILATASLSALQHILKDEPPALRSICMQFYPWPWLNNKEDQRLSIGKSLAHESNRKYTQKVEEALALALAKRIQAAVALVGCENASPRMKNHSVSNNGTAWKRIVNKFNLLRGYLSWRR